MFYKIAITILRPLIYLLFCQKTKGKANEPKEGGFIVCANHQSAIDPIFIASALKRQPHFMAKKELFDNKFLGWLITKLGAFPVNRQVADVTAIKTSIKLLKSDKVVAMFPQGTRMPLAEEISAKDGVCMLCARTKCMILPVYIGYKKGKAKLFSKTKVNIGKPITYEELGFVTGKSNEFEYAKKIISDAIINLSKD